MLLVEPLPIAQGLFAQVARQVQIPVQSLNIPPVVQGIRQKLQIAIPEGYESIVEPEYVMGDPFREAR